LFHLPFTLPHWTRRDRGESHRARVGSSQITDERRAVVLAVDDEPDALEVLRTCLAAEGYEVVAASSGPEALTLLEQSRPDLAIVDVMMPGMTGLELCDQLRRRGEFGELPIILYSAYNMPHSNTGLYDHAFVKPVELDTLLRAMRDLLGRRH
jgi:CheY-like chemotaxis protein